MNTLTRYPFQHSANVFAEKNIESTFAHHCFQSLLLISPLFASLCSRRKDTRAVTNTASILTKTSKAANTNFRYETRFWFVSKTVGKISDSKTFVTEKTFTMKMLLTLHQTPKLANPRPHCRPTVSNYSEYSMVPSISRVLFHPQPEDAPCNGDKGHTWGGKCLTN